MEVFYYHSLWAVTLQVLSAPFTLGFVTIVRHTCFQVFNWVRRKSNSFCLDFKVSIATLLKNPSRLSREVLTKWCPRTIYLVPSLPQKMYRRSLGKTHTSSWDTISSDNLFVKRICCFPLLILVVVLASRKKIDGTDFGCVSIQSYGIVVPIRDQELLHKTC
jgi:hypothetical protein